MGLGSAAWSDTDTGTGMDDDASDIGTVPTTVKGKGHGTGVGVEREGPREKVDVRKAMSAKQGMGQQRQPSRRQLEEVEQSELPYRQSSLRRDITPIPTTTTKADMGQIRPQTLARQSSTKTPNTATGLNGTSKPQLDMNTTSNMHPKPKEPVMYTKTRANKPVPLLARPPTPSPPSNNHLLPGTPLVTSPDLIKPIPGKPLSELQMREAYLQSALNLPLDMLNRVEAEKIGLAPAATLKPVRSTSSVSSGLTTGRLASLVGRDRSPKGEGMKRVVSDSAAFKAGAGATRQMGSNKSAGNKQASHLHQTSMVIVLIARPRSCP